MERTQKIPPKARAFMVCLLGAEYALDAARGQVFDGVKACLERMRIACMPYFLCGVMDVMVGSMRGLGYSILPMVVSLAGACGIRILWIFTVFAADRTIDVLFLSYPVSWGITAIVHMICFLFARRKFPKTDGAPAPAAQGGA